MCLCCSRIQKETKSDFKDVHCSSVISTWVCLPFRLIPVPVAGLLFDSDALKIFQKFIWWSCLDVVFLYCSMLNRYCIQGYIFVMLLLQTLLFFMHRQSKLKLI